MFDIPEPPAAFQHGRSELVAELKSWVDKGSNRPTARDHPFKLILSDVEGCLNLDPLTYDHEVLAELRRVNECATETNALPYITMCTGRQSPFVDAFSAFLSVRLPVIFEGGCGLFFPSEQPGSQRHQWHPAIAEAERSGTYQRLERVVEQIADGYGASQSLGKGRLLTFHAPEGHSIDEMLDGFRQAIDSNQLNAEITRSANAIDISVEGVNKGTAVDWLLDTVEDRGGPRWSREQVIGIGDAPNDVAFLAVVGRSVAPLNAHDSVREFVSSASEFTDAKAVAETVVNAIRWNLDVLSL